MSARGNESNNGINDPMIAASRGDLPRVEALLRHARLFLAARDGDLAKLNELLDAGVDPNALLRDEWTALMIAERKGHAEVARLLRQGRAEKPLPSIITSAGAGGKEIDLSDFPEPGPHDLPEEGGDKPH